MNNSSNLSGEVEGLKEKAKLLRRNILEQSVSTGHSHIGGSFSSVELMISLYHKIMKTEDKFILSKGHACLGLYLLLQTKGFSPKISGHPDRDEENGIPCTTGSLGHGLPIAVGMALARKILQKEGRIFVLVGDGECQEGTTWESLLLAKRFELENLTIIVDHNKLQALSKIDNFPTSTDLERKFNAFGINTLAIDGHDFWGIINSLSARTILKKCPRAIIAHTIKGKGVSYMENDPKWHTRIPNDEELKQAYKELS